MTDDRRHQYPGGKPDRSGKYGQHSIERIPLRGALTPRLRDEATVHPIGFCTDVTPVEEDDEC